MIRKVKNRRQVHRGCVLMDDKENRYLVLEVNLFKGSITVLDSKFNIVAIGIKWIGNYYILLEDEVDMDAMRELMGFGKVEKL